MTRPHSPRARHTLDLQALLPSRRPRRGANHAWLAKLKTTPRRPGPRYYTQISPVQIPAGHAHQQPRLLFLGLATPDSARLRSYMRPDHLTGRPDYSAKRAQRVVELAGSLAHPESVPIATARRIVRDYLRRLHPDFTAAVVFERFALSSKAMAYALTDYYPATDRCRPTTPRRMAFSTRAFEVSRIPLSVIAHEIAHWLEAFYRQGIPIHDFDFTALAFTVFRHLTGVSTATQRRALKALRLIPKDIDRLVSDHIFHDYVLPRLPRHNAVADPSLAAAA